MSEDSLKKPVCIKGCSEKFPCPENQLCVENDCIHDSICPAKIIGSKGNLKPPKEGQLGEIQNFECKREGAFLILNQTKLHLPQVRVKCTDEGWNSIDEKGSIINESPQCQTGNTKIGTYKTLLLSSKVIYFRMSMLRG